VPQSALRARADVLRRNRRRVSPPTTTSTINPPEPIVRAPLPPLVGYASPQPLTNSPAPLGAVCQFQQSRCRRHVARFPKLGRRKGRRLFRG
jgi:hypothetical protein